MGSKKIRYRNSSLEILRLISMMMIVLYHFLNRLDMDINNVFDKFIFFTFSSWGILGTDLFVIISAWFLVDIKKNVFKKTIAISMETISYILLFNVAFLFRCLSGTGGSIRIELDNILSPLFLNQYWFVTAYIIMLTFAPLMNNYINNHSCTEIKYGLVLLSFIPILGNFVVKGDNLNMVSDAIFFMYIYILTAFIKKSMFFEKIKNKYLMSFVSLVIVVLIIVIKMICYNDNNIISSILNATISNTGRYSFILLVLAFSIFCLSYHIEYNNRIINFFAKYTFGIYLFHENATYNITYKYAKLIAMLHVKSISSIFGIIYGVVLFFISFVFSFIWTNTILRVINNKIINKLDICKYDKIYCKIGIK